MKIAFLSLIFTVGVYASEPPCNLETLSRLRELKPVSLESIKVGDKVFFQDGRTGRSFTGYYSGDFAGNLFFSSRPSTQQDLAQEFLQLPPNQIRDLKLVNQESQPIRAASFGGFSIGDRVRIPRSGGGSSLGAVTEVDPEKGLVEVVFPDSKIQGRIGRKWAYPKDLSIAEPEPAHRFSSRIFGNYVSARGEVIEVNPDSKALQEQMFQTLNRMKDQGARPRASSRRPTEDEMKEVSRAWLGQSTNIEQTRPLWGGGIEYGQKRMRLIDGGNGRADLGEIVACKAAVCRELSLFGSLALSELGYKTRVGRGNIVQGVSDSKQVVGAHAWIEFLDPESGEVIGVLDSNYQEKFFSNQSEYFKETRIDPSSATYTVVAEPEQ